MNFNFSFNNDVLVIEVKLKRATSEFAHELKNYLFDKIDNDNITKIVIDLSDAEFTDSSFLGALVSGLKKISAKKGDIKITNLQPAVRTMFELTRLYKVFEIYDTVDSALRNF